MKSLPTDLLRKLPVSLRIELEENLQRKNLTPSEMATAHERIEPELRRFVKPGRPRERRTDDDEIPQVLGNTDERHEHETSRIIAKCLGVSGPTLDKAVKVARAATKHGTKKYSDLVKEMDRIGPSVAYSKLKNYEIQEEAESKFEELSRKDPSTQLPKGAHLFNADFRKAELPSSSFDMIFVDPPYGREYLGLWDGLGKWAQYWLGEGGFLMAYTGHEWRLQQENSLAKYLEWYHPCGVLNSGHTALIWKKSIKVRHKPLCLFSKGKPRKHQQFFDFLTGEPGNKELHPWSQSEMEAKYYIEKLTKPGDIILDPMMGSGTTVAAGLRLGRRAFGIEIDPSTYKRAYTRIAEISI